MKKLKASDIDISDWGKGTTIGGHGKKHDYTFSCYESHPPLQIGDYTLYGGSASSPVVKDADIYVSLQGGSTCGKISDPWDADGHVIEIQYRIADTYAPANIPRFKKMVEWLCNQLQEGKKIHVGCIGGHGRTGLVLAAIVAQLGEPDAIAYVRKHYCHKAVESKEQVEFLVKHFGVTPAKANKSYVSHDMSP